MVTIRYFSRLRNDIGHGEEERDLPVELESMRDLAAWLKNQGPGYAKAFADMRAIRAAKDFHHVGLDTKIGDAKHIAFFPPVTGG